jgi:hypothetical protein
MAYQDNGIPKHLLKAPRAIPAARQQPQDARPATVRDENSFAAAVAAAEAFAIVRAAARLAEATAPAH